MVWWRNSGNGSMVMTVANGRRLVPINGGPTWLWRDDITEVLHQLIGRGREQYIVDVRS